VRRSRPNISVTPSRHRCGSSASSRGFSVRRPGFWQIRMDRLIPAQARLTGNSSHHLFLLP
jgi:hypothetical protein